MFRYYQPMTTWDVVRPSYWYPMAGLEQSLMDLDALADDMRMAFPLRSYRLLTMPSSNDDDDFFKDLPVASRESQATKEVSSGGGGQDESSRAFSNYSYSSSSVVDDQGRRVQSIRRRYEDANGRLKAIHERHLPGKSMVTTWRKKDKNDKGTEETMCSEGVSKEDFENEWKKTPFAKAQESAKPLEGDKTKTLQSGEQSMSSTQNTQQAKEQVAA